MKIPGRPKFIYSGKTKDVAEFASGGKTFLLMRFKDTVLGRGGVPDSGGNRVVGSMPGKGEASAAMTEFFFREFAASGIPTHFVARPSPREIIVEKSRRIDVEFVCRNLAFGGYLARHPRARRLKRLGGVIEYTLKSDSLDDPVLSSSEILSHVGRRELAAIRSAIKKINRAASSAARRAGLVLADFKAEFGRIQEETPPAVRRSAKIRPASDAPTDLRDALADGRESAPRLVAIDDFSCDTARFFRRGRLLGHFEVCRALGIPVSSTKKHRAVCRRHSAGSQFVRKNFGIIKT